MFQDKELSALKNLLTSTGNVILTSHHNPDGDAVGSLLAMYHYLKNKGLNVAAVLPNEFPEFYSWMPGADEILIYEKQSKAVKEVFEKGGVVFSLDYNAFHRVGQMTDLLKNFKGKYVMIDHHPEPENGYDLYFSNIDSSSTGEIVYNIIKGLGDKELINQDIAVALYVAVMTDTGSFSYSCNNPETYRVTADLIEKGVDASKVHKLVYDNYSVDRLRLMGFALSERMIVWPELHSAVIYLTKEDLTRFNYKPGDTEGLVNYPLSIAEVNVSVLITEKERKIRLSFRSKGDFAVNELVKKYFDGGGHKNAAGGYSYVNMQQTLKNVKSVLEKYKKDLDFKIEY